MADKPKMTVSRAALFLVCFAWGAGLVWAVFMLATRYDHLDHGATKTLAVGLSGLAAMFGYGWWRKYHEVSIAAGAFALLAVMTGAGGYFEMDGGRYGGAFRSCCSNLKNLGTALEMYSTDNSGAFPDRLSQLTPNYVKTIPTCASAHRDTYSNGYSVTHPRVPGGHAPDAYTVVCEGSYHVNATQWPPNYPQYTDVKGLIAPDDN